MRAAIVEDLSGIRFGKLTPLNRSRIGPMGKTWWHCVCECGNEHVVLAQHLKSGKVSSCGCAIKEIVIARNKGWLRDLANTRGKNGLLAKRNRLFYSYAKSSVYRNIEFLLTREEWDDLVDSPCYYCTDISKPFGGIDRVDNTIGYVLENCVPCCKTCNLMKRVSTKDEFIRQCQKIAKRFE